MIKLHLFPAIVFLCQLAVNVHGQIWTPICVSLHCGKQWGACLFDTQCRKALACNAKCVLGRKNVNKCNLLCELNFGYGSAPYKNALQCGVDNKCFPQPDQPDGVCLVPDNDDERLDTSLTDLDQVVGFIY